MAHTTNDRRLDGAGILTLVVSAATGVILWWLVYLSLPAPGIGIVPTVLIGAGTAALIVSAQLWEWQRSGGRRSVARVNGWIRADEVPPSISVEVWGPLLQLREWAILRSRYQFLSAAIFIVLALLHLLNGTPIAQNLFWVVAIFFWLWIVARTVYVDVHTLPIVRRMLRSRYSEENLTSGVGVGGAPFETVAWRPPQGPT
jgi:hypothetical protein